MTATPIPPGNYHPIFANLKNELHRHIVGQDHLIDRLLVALLADGHVLLEGVPGLAKTKTLVALTEIIAGTMSRIQFTPDLLPSDVVGTEVYRPQTGDFVIRRGPVFANLLLADEINRAPAKVQSALLQAMQERRVTIGDETFNLPRPFMVLATQNPIEQEGTYPLPEAQLDRFLMKVVVTYPSFEEELRIVKQETSATPPAPLHPVIDLARLLELRAEAQNLFIDEKIDRYIVSLVQATRRAGDFGIKEMVSFGASPRASLALRSAARAQAFIRGRTFVTPDDVRELALDILRHRVLVTFEAEARGVTSDEVVTSLLKSVAIP